LKDSVTLVQREKTFIYHETLTAGVWRHVRAPPPRSLSTKPDSVFWQQMSERHLSTIDDEDLGQFSSLSSRDLPDAEGLRSLLDTGEADGLMRASYGTVVPDKANIQETSKEKAKKKPWHHNVDIWSLVFGLLWFCTILLTTRFNIRSATIVKFCTTDDLRTSLTVENGMTFVVMICNGADCFDSSRHR
jgi:hypothetical protein